MRSLAAEAIARCVEAFDAGLRTKAPRSWSAHERAGRTLVMLLGEVSFSRTVFLDESGRRRALADELLGVPKRARLSAGAFLWIVRRLAEESYRKTAAAFEEATGRAISHVTVMNCVRAEGALLEAAPADPGPRISQEEVFLEVDGLWVHLQEGAHREEALPRFYTSRRGKRNPSSSRSPPPTRARGGSPRAASSATGWPCVVRQEMLWRSGRGRVSWWATPTPSRT